VTYFLNSVTPLYITCSLAQTCYSVIGDKPFLWSKAKFDLP